MLVKQCGKTHGLYKFLCKKVKTEWVTGIEIDEQRDVEIQSCFSNNVELHFITEPDELMSLIKKSELRNRDIANSEINSAFSGKITMDCLIFMDDVSEIADNYKKFAEFLTVCRKYRYHCVFVFHIVWKNILSQTNILNIFHRVCHTTLLQKFLKVVVGKHPTNMFLLIQCGLIGYLLTLLTQTNNIA